MLYCSSLVDIMSTMGSLQFNSKGYRLFHDVLDKCDGTRKDGGRDGS